MTITTVDRLLNTLEAELQKGSLSYDGHYRFSGWIKRNHVEVNGWGDMPTAEALKMVRELAPRPGQAFYG